MRRIAKKEGKLNERLLKVNLWMKIMIDQWLSIMGNFAPREHLAMCGDIGVVITWGERKRYDWHLGGRGWGCCLTACNVQDSSPQQRTIQPKCEGSRGWEALPEVKQHSFHPRKQLCCNDDSSLPDTAHWAPWKHTRFNIWSISEHSLWALTSGCSWEDGDSLERTKKSLDWI